MTTEIKPSSGRSEKFNNSSRIELLNKIEGIPDDINGALFIENEGIITVSDDKLVFSRFLCLITSTFRYLLFFAEPFACG